MQAAICLLAVVPVRKEPSHRSEMVSQLLFGEYVLMEEVKEDFVFVKCLYDGYSGWVQANQLTPVPGNQVLSTDRYLAAFTAGVYIDGQCRQVPCCVPYYPSAQPGELLSIGSHKISYPVGETAVWNAAHTAFNEENLQKLIGLFLGTPYLWGGKSVFGIDCSGFAQQVFKMFGIKLLRDAYLQAEQGEPVESLADARLGDLAFFHNEKGRITHVGILLSSHQIVHAAGQVRIDAIDKEGIINRETGKRTHHLHSVRRFFSRPLPPA